jgi:hypothetical protein
LPITHGRVGDVLSFISPAQDRNRDSSSHQTPGQGHHQRGFACPAHGDVSYADDRIEKAFGFQNAGGVKERSQPDHSSIRKGKKEEGEEKHLFPKRFLLLIKELIETHNVKFGMRSAEFGI